MQKNLQKDLFAYEGEDIGAPEEAEEREAKEPDEKSGKEEAKKQKTDKRKAVQEEDLEGNEGEQLQSRKKIPRLAKEKAENKRIESSSEDEESDDESEEEGKEEKFSYKDRGRHSDEIPSKSAQAGELLATATEELLEAEYNYEAVTEDFEGFFQATADELKVSPSQLALYIRCISAARAKKHKSQIAKKLGLPGKLWGCIEYLLEKEKEIKMVTEAWLGKKENLEAAKLH